MTTPDPADLRANAARHHDLPDDLAVFVTSDDPDEMLQQARTLAKYRSGHVTAIAADIRRRNG